MAWRGASHQCRSNLLADSFRRTRSTSSATASGVVALAVLVYDRTKAVAPTAAFFFAAKFLPALLAPALTARLDQVALRRILPALYVVEALAFGPWR